MTSKKPTSVDEILAQWRSVRPDLDVAAMGTVGHLTRVYNHFAAAMTATFAQHDLNPSGFDVLATLKRSGPPYRCSVGQLMHAMMVTSGTTTNRLQRLEQAKLIKRTTDPQDARKGTVELTPKGLETIDRAIHDHIATQQKLISPLSSEEKTTLEKILRKLEAEPEIGN